MNKRENQRKAQFRFFNKTALCTLLFLLLPLPAFANIWVDSFGKAWFYESRSVAGEVVAGSWSVPALAAGKTYNISFYVTKMQGETALYVGDAPRVVIDRTGYYSVDFKVAWGGK